MEFFTLDEKRNIGLPLCLEKNEEFKYKAFSMFRLIFIYEGTGIIKINGKRILFMAPTILCLNEQDVLEVEQFHNTKAKTIYFNPVVVNNIFTIEKLKENPENLSQTEYADYCLLLPFISGVDRTSEIIQIGLTAEKRIMGFFQRLSNELETLDNNFWRCRSRSIIYEVLSFLQYLYTEMTLDNNYKVLEDEREIDKIILYIHANYDEKITLNHLTEIFHINRTTLSEEFTKATGITFANNLLFNLQHSFYLKLDNVFSILLFYNYPYFKLTEYLHQKSAYLQEL